MGMSLDRMLYLQAKGALPPGAVSLLDMGPQNVYGITAAQIRAFVAQQGQRVDRGKLESEIERLIYFSTPRPGERTTLLSEITDLTNIEYNSYDICPGLRTDIVDLNFDNIPKFHRNSYDVVLNFGTTEHIFNQWNSFKIIHCATKIGGHIYFQLPMSGYLDHGYYCYTPLFFTDLIAANRYELLDLFVTEAGESDVLALGIDVRHDSESMQPHSGRVPPQRAILTSFNIHVLVRKTADRGFRCGAEIATAHAPIDPRIKANYAEDIEQDDPTGLSQRILANLTDTIASLGERVRTTESRLEESERQLAQIRASTSWQLTAPLRAIVDAARRARN